MSSLRPTQDAKLANLSATISKGRLVAKNLKPTLEKFAKKAFEMLLSLLEEQAGDATDGDLEKLKDALKAEMILQQAAPNAQTQDKHDEEGEDWPSDGQYAKFQRALEAGANSPEEFERGLKTLKEVAALILNMILVQNYGEPSSGRTRTLQACLVDFILKLGELGVPSAMRVGRYLEGVRQ